MIITVAERTARHRQRASALPGVRARIVGVADETIRNIAPAGAGPIKIVAVAADEERDADLNSQIAAGGALKPVAAKLIGDRAAVRGESDRHVRRRGIDREAGGSDAGLRLRKVSRVVLREGADVVNSLRLRVASRDVGESPDATDYGRREKN